ncbi:MAG: hypothetical protein U0Y10_02180 [Spirosomataceae bacterium]
MITTADAGIYSLTVSLTTGCSASTTVSVGVNTATASASSNSPVCTGTSINLSATGGGTYSWSGPSGFSSTAQNPTRTNVTTAMEGSYTVTITNASGCTASATVFVDVNSVTGSAGSDSPACIGETINFTASGGTAYSWSGTI